MTRATRADILAKLRSKIATGTPIIGGADTGLSAKAEEAGGTRQQRIDDAGEAVVTRCWQKFSSMRANVGRGIF